MLRRFCACSAGAVAVVTALVLPALLGFASLGVEVGHWYLVQREMQGSADAAAISAMAQYMGDFVNNPSSTTYKTVGVNYASYNGQFSIPASNVCTITSSGASAGCTVTSIDTRALPAGCMAANTVCIAVEVTQDTSLWWTTQHSLEPTPNKIGVQRIPTPTLKARAIVSAQTKTTTVAGADCILALANATNAVTVEGGGDLVARCGVAIDGGIDQNASGTAIGGITFNGSGAKAEVTTLVMTGNYTENQECLTNAQHCYLWSATQSPPAGAGSTTALPVADFLPKTATQDPYAATVAAMFQKGGIGVPPEGVASVTINTRGSGYTNGTRTFTLTGGSGTAPAKVLATVSQGKVTAILGVFDPGAYNTVPGGQPAGTPDTGGGSGATFTLTEGCFTWPGTSVGGMAWTPIPGRKYCSIFNHGQATINFPAGNYYIAGGDGNCVGLCQSGNNASMISAVAGVTFFLTNGEGATASSYATMSIQSGTVKLCSPGTNCGTTCTNATQTSCLLIIQNPAAPLSTGLKTINNIVNGNGTNILAGLVYLPKQTFSTVGTSSIGGCFGVIAYYIDIGGTPEFSNGCLPGNGIGGTTQVSIIDPYLYQ